MYVNSRSVWGSERDQARASRWRASGEMSRVIETIDGLGNKTRRRARGRMATTEHETILSILEKRASRFRPNFRLTEVENQGGGNNYIDETGTLETWELQQEQRERELQARLLEESELENIEDEVLEVHGERARGKQEGMIRLLYENANGIDGRFNNNEKVAKAKELHNELEADVVAYCEHRINLKHKLNKVGFNQLFWGGEAEVRSVVAHNIHADEIKGRTQEGGTSMLAFGGVIDYLDMSKSGKDESGLGRWVVMTFESDVRTRIVCGYNPCGNDKTNSGTVYQQHRRYWITKRRSLVCPRVKFREDLVKQLRKWRADGDRLIVCLDANEDIYKKSIGKALTSVEGLGMKEVVGEFTGKKIGPTYFRGKKPIDGIWATTDIQVCGACIMPAGYGIGDHRLFIVDFLGSSCLGTNLKKVVRPQARRLNCKLGRAVEKYNQKLEQQILRHRMIERVGQVYTSGLVGQEAKERLDMIDAESKQYMANAEKKCRKIRSGVIPFSPDAAKWIRRLQVYKSLLGFLHGKGRNRGNLRRAAYRAGIPQPFQLREADILARIKICEEHCAYYKANGKQHRRRLLQEKARHAKEMGDTKVENEILGIIKRERERAFWRRVKYAMKKQSGGSVRVVQVEDDEGELVEFTSQAEVHEAIWSNIHRKRFFLAEEAPICNTPLREEFGYNADTEAGEEVLEGVFQFDEEFDEHTRDIMEETSRTRAIIPKNSVDDIIRSGCWGSFWSKAREETSSSESGLTFSHYKAGTNSHLITHFHATKSSVAIKAGIGLERWSRGLSVMLQKIPGCNLIAKLRSILLMEADFNCTNKIIYGVRMMNNVRKYGFMPDEVFSEKNRTAEEGSLAKVLFYDVVRQSRRPAGISSVDADNCFDRVSHAIAALVFRSFGVSQEASEAMLRTIQGMKFFLRTAFGDSLEFAGATAEVKTQGLCQGNGAAPAGWAVISITILNAHKRKGHGAKFLCPISLVRTNLAAVLYVDDTDVIHLDMTKEEDKLETLHHLQRSVDNWGKLLIATGGSLKPSKCFYHLISFSWKPDGSWYYDANEHEDELTLEIPLPDGSYAEIAHCGVEEAHKTLGVITCPSGNSKPTIEHMKEAAKGWIDQATSAKLARRNFWCLVKVQFWPKVGYGIGASSARYLDLAECLMKQYYDLVPLGGIRRSANRMVRQLDRGFYGVGCPHPGIECLVAQCSRILTHYGCETAVGKLLQVSIELLVLELGVSSQPFQADYNKYNKWVTDCWLKSVWEKVFLFGVVLIEGKLKVKPPRHNDGWLMVAFEELHLAEPELIRLNRVRLHQQAIFISDVMDAGGRALDQRYLKKREDGETWSAYQFPKQEVSRKDIRLWREALHQLRHVRTAPLGDFIAEGHKRWEWRFDEAQNRLLRFHEDGMDIYSPSEVPRYANRPNCWTRSRLDQAPIEVGQLCTVRSVAAAVWRISSYTPAPGRIGLPQSLQAVFEQWGNDWIWKDLRLEGGSDWLATSINAGDCIAVADGSYMPDLRTDLCSTAFFFECRRGRGKLVGSFAEVSASSNAYRGELLGIMTVHLILLGMNTLHPNLGGSVRIYSDCKGALDKVENLPPGRIPSQCKHSDVLKTIMVNCSSLSFDVQYEHIEAHQDEHTDFSQLSRPAQLNCAVDAGAKRALLNVVDTATPEKRCFPLEPIACFVGKEKMTSESGDLLRFWAQRRLAREALVESKVLNIRQFDAIAWEAVYEGLHSVPQLFQLWACKQVWDIAGTNYLRSKWDESVEKWCPSCRGVKETAGHVLHCNEVGRVSTLMATIGMLGVWMEEVDTAPELSHCILEYARGRGYKRMVECINGKEHLRRMAEQQDVIGWRRFMEGMFLGHMICIQNDYHKWTGEGLPAKQWAGQLVVRLLEITHGQWVYRNIQVHDEMRGSIRTAEKEKLLQEIEAEMELGFEGFLDMDRSLASVALEDLEHSGGQSQEYWLAAVRAARAAKDIATTGDRNTAKEAPD